MSMTYTRPDPTQPGWADIGEAVRPHNEDIEIGWPDTQIPPSRQQFNWLDKQQDAAYKYLCRVAIAEYHNAEHYQGFGLAIGSNGSVYWNLRECVGIDPVFDNAGFWELTPIRISDADARYLTKWGAAELYLTMAQGDARYPLRPELANYVTFVQGDARYALKGDLYGFLTQAQGDARYPLRDELGNYITWAQGDARYPLRGELSVFETIAHAAATYLRIADAAATYLSQSAAAQLYLTIADANNRFAQTAADARAYTDTAINNSIAAQQNWTRGYVAGVLPGMSYRRQDVSNGSTLVGTWLVMTASPNNGQGFEFAWGGGLGQQGDVIPLPTSFPVGQMVIGGCISSALGQYTGGDALLNLVFDIGSPGNVIANCYYTKANDGNTPRSRGFCYGRWWGIGHRTT